MSHMADRDHIAITSGDASTTGRKVSVPGCPLAPPTTVTEGDSSDTYSRIGPDLEILPMNNALSHLRSSVGQLEFGKREPPAVCALVHRDRELTLPFSQPFDGRVDLRHGLVTAKRVVAE